MPRPRPERPRAKPVVADAYAPSKVLNCAGRILPALRDKSTSLRELFLKVFDVTLHSGNVGEPEWATITGPGAHLSAPGRAGSGLLRLRSRRAVPPWAARLRGR